MKLAQNKMTTAVITTMAILSSISSASASKMLQRSIASETYQGVNIDSLGKDSMDETASLKCTHKIRDLIFARAETNAALKKELTTGSFTIQIKLIPVDSNEAYNAVMTNSDNYKMDDNRLYVQVAFGDQRVNGENQCDLPQDVAEFLSSDSNQS